MKQLGRWKGWQIILGKRLYYCMLWRKSEEEPMIKFIYADDVKELIEEFLYFGFASVSVTDITNMEVEAFEV